MVGRLLACTVVLASTMFACSDVPVRPGPQSTLENFKGICQAGFFESQRSLMESYRGVEAGKVIPCFTTSDLGDCPNWESALEQARKRAACAGPTGDPASKCQRRLAQCAKACDICRILEPGAGPRALQRHLSTDPLVGNRGLTCPAWSFICPGWGNLSSDWEVMFHILLCTEPKYVDLLASTMIHEAVHSCGSITGKKIMDWEAPECDPYEIEPECVK